MSNNPSTSPPHHTPSLPRITINFCTQCKWNLRAAYYAQELLQTFSTSIGEIALVPCSGGMFSVEVLYEYGNKGDDGLVNGSSGGGGGNDVSAATTTATSTARDSSPRLSDRQTLVRLADNRLAIEEVLWDRKLDGGFPETKELKGRVRNLIEPQRDLGHVDRALKKGKEGDKAAEEKEKESGKGKGQGVDGNGIRNGNENAPSSDKNATAEACEDCK